MLTPNIKLPTQFQFDVIENPNSIYLTIKMLSGYVWLSGDCKDFDISILIKRVQFVIEDRIDGILNLRIKL